IIRIVVWQRLGLYDYGAYWPLVALTVGLALTAIVTFGSMVGSMLPFALKRLGFDPATASAPFVATLVDVTGLVIYFCVCYLVLRGTLLGWRNGGRAAQARPCRASPRPRSWPRASQSGARRERKPVGGKPRGVQKGCKPPPLWRPLGELPEEKARAAMG